MHFDQALAFEIREQPGHGFARRAKNLRNFFVREGENRPYLSRVRSMSGRKIEQEAGQLFFRRPREPQVTDLAISSQIDLAQDLRHPQRDLAMSSEKVQEWFSGDEIGLQRL